MMTLYNWCYRIIFGGAGNGIDSFQLSGYAPEDNGLIRHVSTPVEIIEENKEHIIIKTKSGSIYELPLNSCDGNLDQQKKYIYECIQYSK